jgi:predicted nuclease of predicted toxin-antitoxin system
MRFVLDMNSPPAMADWLRADGHDAVHVREIGYANLSDREIFSRAVEEGRIVITFDLDFGEIVALTKGAAPGVVLLRLRLARQPYLRERLRAAINETAEALQAGDRPCRGWPDTHSTNAAGELKGAEAILLLADLRCVS